MELRESSRRELAASNFPRRKFAPKKIRLDGKRISFRDVAKFARPRKTIEFLCDKTGKDRSTVKRWLSGESRVPDTASNAVWADIFARYG